MSTRASYWSHLPEWARSIRFRLTLLYSGVLFGIAALLVAALYIGVSIKLRGEPLANQMRGIDRIVTAPDGTVLRLDRLVLTEARAFEQIVNQNTLEHFKTFSFAALGVLFVLSLGVGWVISGRVLAPIGDITEVARGMHASGLGRRLRLEGPEDELKHLADTFDDMLSRLDEAFSTQQQFIADASHELRNPLAIIRTNLDLALTDPNSGPAEMRRAAEVARRAVDRMARMVDDLLVLARQERPEIALAEFDLGHALAEVADEFDAPARARGVELVRDLAAGVRIEADRDAIKRAAANLLENAVRVSTEGERVVIECGEASSWAWIAIADEGPGIPEENTERIFDRFWRSDAGRGRLDGGTGLGLPIVRRIVESHSGEIRLTSEVGKGSTFLLWLPSSADPDRSPPPGRPKLLRL